MVSLKVLSFKCLEVWKNIIIKDIMSELKKLKNEIQIIKMLLHDMR